MSAAAVMWKPERETQVATTLTERTRRLNSRAGQRRRLPALLLMTDEARLPDPEAAAARLPRGAGVVLRHYGQAPAQRAALAERLAALCRRRGLILLVAGDARLAFAVGAAGVHLPEGLARFPRAWRAFARPGWLVTAAAHGPAALARAARAGADAALLAPVFPTASHPGAPAIGPLRFALWCRAAALPVYALGGIDAARARRLAAGGAAGIAGIGGVVAQSGVAPSAAR
jgi:thiamine-phosphate pyrophosphorylase